MADIKKLHETRANLLTQATSIVAEAAESGVALEGDKKNQFEALTAEAGVIAEAIRSEKSAAEARSAADAVRAEFASVIAPKAEKSDDEVAELRALGRNGGGRTFEYRWTFMAPSGSVRWLSEDCSSLLSPSGISRTVSTP